VRSTSPFGPVCVALAAALFASAGAAADPASTLNATGPTDGAAERAVATSGALNRKVASGPPSAEVRQTLNDGAAPSSTPSASASSLNVRTDSR
jgi:hypothetical protein